MTREQKLAEIHGLVARLDEVQKFRKLSNKQLVDEFSKELLSTRTWSKLHRPDLEGLNVDNALTRLRRAAVILDGGSPDETFFKELPFPSEMLARVELLERQKNDRRILVCLAANGCGKSAFTRWAVAQNRAGRAAVRIRPTWRNRMVHICCGIARALGAELNTNNPADAEAEVIKLLSGEPKTLFLDQAHEGGVAVMHMLRAFVDETPSRFVYLAYDTAYQRVITASTDAMIEAQAFLGRCMKPVFDAYKRGILPKDVAAYARLVGDLPAEAARALSAKVTPLLQKHTNLRLLDDALEFSRAQNDNDEPETDQVVNALHHLLNLQATELTAAKDANAIE